MANNKNDWKERLNIVYSTNPDFSYITDEKEENESDTEEPIVADDDYFFF